MKQKADINVKVDGMSIVEAADDKGYNKIVALLKGEPIPEDDPQDNPQIAQLQQLLGSFSQIADMKKGATQDLKQWDTIRNRS
eukprot:UN20151